MARKAVFVSFSVPYLPVCRTTQISRAAFWRRSELALCTPGMGVILWGESPLYVNPVNKSMIC